ncbi:MAG: hypothetical protein AAGA88_05375 [Pseudomonadota bacterium]
MLDVQNIEPQQTAKTAGTRFLIFPQPPHLAGYEKPEPIWISTPPNEIAAGPADRRMYVVDPLFSKDPYSFPALPPFNGATYPEASAGPDGHFDHFEVGSREFVCAHAFACNRFVLDVWETYLGREITWHFAESYDRLEIIPYLSWYNAQSGYGFVELGTDQPETGVETPHALNFDVIAHELGHSILFAEMGFPVSGFDASREFFGYHEVIADTVSLLSLMHFDSVLERLLLRSKGNLLTLNELNRIAELSGDRQIRIASNDRKMSMVTDEVHDLSKPLTGALFDTMIEIYHRNVEERGLVDLPDTVDWYRLRDMTGEEIEEIGYAFEEASGARHGLLKGALQDARDLIGLSIAQSWATLEPDGLTFAIGGAAIADQLDAVGETHAADRLMDNLRWREIIA